jgi:hypothetical protein
VLSRNRLNAYFLGAVQLPLQKVEDVSLKVPLASVAVIFPIIRAVPLPFVALASNRPIYRYFAVNGGVNSDH